MENFENVKEKTWEEIDAKWGKKHPARHWVNDTLFKGHGLFGYSAYHALTHPHVLLADLSRQIKWAWQRVFRGWDDRVSWSIDCYLDDYLPLWIERLIKYKKGIPVSMFKDEDYVEGSPNYEIKDESLAIRKKEFDAILQKIADGFRLHKKIIDLEFEYDTPEDKEAREKFNTAFDLFKEHYESLWD